MNLDRLKALIRLANNNPNDNEANLAARKVCKLLDTNQFAIIQGKKKSNVEESAAKTWNDVKRSTEPEFRSRNPFTGTPFEEFFRQRKYWTDSAPHVDAPEPGFDANDFVSKKVHVKYQSPDPPRRNPQDDFDWITGKRSRKQEIRKCSKCGLEIMTFRTDENPWICNPCHWKDKI